MGCRLWGPMYPDYGNRDISWGIRLKDNHADTGAVHGTKAFYGMYASYHIKDILSEKMMPPEA